MVNSLFISSIFLVVLVMPGLCDKVTVCKEEDGDIRIDCRIAPKPNHINNYEFSTTTGGKETIMATNISGSNADVSYKEKIEISPLDTGFRLRWKNQDLKENVTFLCKVSSVFERVTVEKGKMLECSAISVFLHSCHWLLPLLVSLHVTQSWVLSAL